MLLNQGEDLGNTDDQPNIKAALKDDWFKKPNSNCNTTKTIDFRPPQTWISKIAKARKPLLTFDELMSTSFGERPIALLLDHERLFEIKQAFREEQHQPENIQELLRKHLNDLQVLNGILPERGKHAAQISTPYWKCPVFYDDDDDEYSIKYKEYLENSVEDLVLFLSESEGIFDDTCDVPFCDNSPPLDVLNDHFELFFDFNDDCTSCDDFSPINIFEEKSVTFSNPLFTSNDDFTSSNDESLSDEDVSKDNVKIYSNPLFEFDDEYISSDVNPLFDEVLENIKSKDSYDSNLDEPNLLVTPLFDINEDECFDPGGDVDEINDFENGYYDSEGDILYLESLLSNDTTPNLPPEVFLDRDLRSLRDEPNINDLMIEDKVFDPRIHDQIFSLTYDCPDFEDSHARGFVLRLLELQSFTYGNPIS
nr:hypothetical protein [Tanacetum cinerariifolium]